MKRALSALTVFLGILAIPACGFVLHFMMGFGGLRLWSQEGMEVIALGLLGPLALLPAGILAMRRPRLAGLWLLTGGLGSAILYYWRYPEHSSLIHAFPLLFGFLPLMLLGTGFLAAGLKEPASGTRVRWPLAFILPTILACAGAVVDFQDLFVDHEWTLSVEPAGGEPRRFRFDDRGGRQGDAVTMAGTLQEFFRKPPAVGDRIPLGVISLQRPRESDGIPPLERHHYEAGREAGGEFSLLVVYRDGKRWVSQPDNGLAFDVGVSALLMDLDKRMQDRRVRLWQERR